MYLNHQIDSVTHEQRDNEEVYHYRVYVAFLLYLCLQKYQSMKTVIRYPNANLNKATSTKVTS